MQAADQVPMRWPSGPDWLKPGALSILDGTPVNCLLLTAAQRNDGAFMNAVQQRKLAVVDAATPGTAPATIPAEPVWPGVKMAQSRGDAEAGPTGPPWVDSNGWRCLLARAKHPGKPVWIMAEPPADLNISRMQPYALVIADAAAYGGRWVVSLDPHTAKGITAREPASLERWGSIVRGLQFFEKRSAWRSLPSAAKLGVLSDFEGPNEFMGHELLNLMPRRFLSSRVLDLPRTTPASLEGLKGVIWVDEKAPEGAMLKTLMAFVQKGGLLILPASAAHLAPKGAGAKKHKTGYPVYPSGSGSIAVAPEPWADPYVVASDAHLLISRRYDVYRVFNSGATNVHCVDAPSGGTVMHILNYTGRTSYNPMSAFVARSHSTARWSHFGAEAPEALKISRAAEGVEVNLPSFAAYAAIEFGGQS